MAIKWSVVKTPNSQCLYLVYPLLAFPLCTDFTEKATVCCVKHRQKVPSPEVIEFRKFKYSTKIVVCMYNYIYIYIACLALYLTSMPM